VHYNAHSKGLLMWDWLMIGLVVLLITLAVFVLLIIVLLLAAPALLALLGDVACCCMLPFDIAGMFSRKKSEDKSGAGPPQSRN
jgi:hypothetical protein